MDRFLKKQLLSDLKEKMVLLAGPRQVGKTTLAKSLYGSFDYLNWDTDEGRSRLLAKQFQKTNLWIFDEIHKYSKWRNYLKGIVDAQNSPQKILVTGSARLDVLRKGGDSLQGRYHFLRLMPLSYKELGMRSQADLKELFALSGFPEPFFKGSQTACRRWSRAYRERIVRQELASVEQFQDIASIELLLGRLPEMTMGTVSVNGLSEDLQVDHKTVKKWILALERLYAIFRIAPFGSSRIKALKKQQKIYFFDWNAIVESGPRFENLVAVHLQKWIYFLQDVEGRNLELRYFRDKQGHEVDFVVTENSKPILFLETKLDHSPTSKGLRYLKAKFTDVRAIQIHLFGEKEYVTETGIEHLPAFRFLSELL